MAIPPPFSRRIYGTATAAPPGTLSQRTTPPSSGLNPTLSLSRGAALSKTKIMAPSKDDYITVTTRVPLPAYLSADIVLEALHTYEPLITANPYAMGFERRPVDVQELVGDPFFREDGHKLEAFVVYDKVPIIPGVGSWASKQVVIPCVFQSFSYGVRCRALAQAGVTVRSSYEVRRRSGSSAGPNGSTPEDQQRPAGAPAGDYELVEVAQIECGALVKPFVKRSFSSAHQEILQRVVESIVRRGGNPLPELPRPSTDSRRRH